MKIISRIKLIGVIIGLSLSGIAIAQNPWDGYDKPDNIVDPSSTRCFSPLASSAFVADTSWTYPKIFNSANRGNYYATYTVPLVGDMDNDGKPEIIVLGTVGAYNATLYSQDINHIDIIKGDGTVKKRIGNTGINTNASDFATFNSETAGGWHGSPCPMAIAKIKGETYPCILLITGGDNNTTAGSIYCYQIVDNQCNYVLRWSRTAGRRCVLNYTVANPNISSTPGDLADWAAATPTISDFNGDGKPEFLVYNKIFDLATGELVATTEEDMTNANVGRRSWFPSRSRSQELNMSFMSVSDFDGDGIVEIAAGNKIYIPKLNSDKTFQGTCDIIKYDFFSSLTQAPSVRANANNYGDGFTALGDMNGDGKLDVVVMGRSLSNTGTEYCRLFVWTPDFSTKTGSLVGAQSLRNNVGTGVFGMPFIGDIDGKTVNGKLLPEVAFCGGYSVETAANLTPKIFPGSSSELNGTNIRQVSSNPTNWGNLWALTFDSGEGNKENALKISWILKHSDESQSTGLTVFDFNNSGTAKVVYQDERSLRVIDASTKDFVPISESLGSTVLLQNNLYSYTGYEYPVIADVNGDNAADFILFGGYNGRTTTSSRLYLYEGKGAGFAGAPPKWNQFVYFPTLINSDMTVPSNPMPLTTKFGNATPYNGTLLQVPLAQKNADGTLLPTVYTPDAVISNLQVVGTPGSSSTTISFKVKNTGDASISVLTPITIYTGASISEGTKVSTVTYQSSTPSVTGAIYPNDEVTVTYTLSGDFRGQKLWVRLTDDGTNFPAAGYYECVPADNSMYTGSAIATADAASVANGRSVAVDVLANDYKYCDNTSTQITLKNSPTHGIISLTSDNKVTYISSQEGYTGSDSFSYTFTCDGMVSNEVTVSITVAAGDAFSAVTWTGGAGNNDWNNAANWVKNTGATGGPNTVPGFISNVTIPGGLSIYPQLKESDYAICKTIAFGAGAELGAPTYLASYQKASVDLSIKSNRWNMIAPPLQNLYSGDLYPKNTVAPYTRVEATATNPSIYQQMYQQANPQTSVAKSAATWSKPYNSLAQEYVFGKSFAIWADKGEAANAAGTTVVFGFPMDSTKYSIYEQRSDLPTFKQKVGESGILSRINASRFIYDSPSVSLASDKSFDYPVENGAEAGYNSVIIGNPWMSHIDFFKFYNTAQNQDKIGNSFKIQNSARIQTYETYIIDGSTITSTDGGLNGLMIPPMQSFILDKKEGANFTTVNFNPVASVTAPSMQLRSDSTSKAELFRVQVIQDGERASGILIRQKEGASNDFAFNEDVWTTFVSNKAATTIYSIVNDQTTSGAAVSINTVGNFNDAIELGVKTSYIGRLKLNFTDLKELSVASEIWLEDKLIKDENGKSLMQNIMINPDYEFDPQVGDSENGRFFLHVKTSKTPTVIDHTEAESYLRISVLDHTLKVVSTYSDPIHSVSIIDVQGRVVFSKNNLNQDYVTITIPDYTGVYIVRATTEKTQKAQKIQIK